MNKKISEACQVLSQCLGKEGLHASSNRYQEQCWTRDFAHNEPAISMLTSDGKMNQNQCVIINHLLNMCKLQTEDGKIPIQFIDDEKKFIMKKMNTCLMTTAQTGQVKRSFVLDSFLENKLSNLTPNTKDSEILFIQSACRILQTTITMEPQQRATIISSIHKAFNYIMKNIYSVDYGSVIGGDWRDVREDLNDKFLLTNACLFYKSCLEYIKLIEFEKSHHLNSHIDLKSIKDIAINIKTVIQNKYWNEDAGYFIDYPDYYTIRENKDKCQCVLTAHRQDHPQNRLDGSNFDILGNAFAVLYGIADFVQTEKIFENVEKLKPLNNTKIAGYEMRDAFLTSTSEEEEKIIIRDRAFIWPFNSLYMSLAMLYHVKCISPKSKWSKWLDIVKREIDLWSNTNEFYEWYDIIDGKGYGSENQAWSAAMFLRVVEEYKSI